MSSRLKREGGRGVRKFDRQGKRRTKGWEVKELEDE